MFSGADARFIQLVKDQKIDDAKAMTENEMSREYPSRDAINEALVVAVRQDHPEMAGWLMRELGADPDQYTNPEYELSLLQYASHYRNLEIVRVLLQFVKNINHISKHGKTAFHYAIDNDEVDICRLLIQAGASANHRGKNEKGKVVSSQIGSILAHGRIEIARELFNHNPQSLTDFKKVYSNIAAYINDKNGEFEARLNMIQYLIEEVPQAWMTGELLLPDEVAKKEVIANLSLQSNQSWLVDLCRARFDTNAFLFSLRKNADLSAKAKVSDALSRLKNLNASMLANDLFLVMSDHHPVISQYEMNGIFRMFIGVVISNEGNNFCMKLGEIFRLASGSLLASDLRDHEATQKVVNLALLSLLSAFSYGEDGVSSGIIYLLSKIIPGANKFESYELGARKLSTFIAEHHQGVESVLSDLQSYLNNTMNLRLTAGQVNPCTRLEMMLMQFKMVKLQEENQSLQVVASQIQAVKERNAALDAKNNALYADNLLLRNHIAAANDAAHEESTPKKKPASKKRQDRPKPAGKVSQPAVMNPDEVHYKKRFAFFAADPTVARPVTRSVSGRGKLK